MPERNNISASWETWFAESKAQRARGRQAVGDAIPFVSMFNAHMAERKVALFYPVIGAALLSKHHWVRVACDSCDSVTELDLRMKPRDPDTSIRVVLRDLSCPRCNGNVRPRIISLANYASRSANR